MSFDVIDLMLQAGIIVKLVLLVLFGFSIVSWAIIVSKWREMRAAARENESFLTIYREEAFNAAYDGARELEQSPAAVLFVATCDEMGRLARETGRTQVYDIDSAQMRVVSKHLQWVSAQEIQHLERGLPFLATTGSSSVYIGLFGTVVGIIEAFQGIAASGSASLAVVAPGIAEALIATAAGLIAAIPATIFYNHFAAEVDREANTIGRFSIEFEEDLRHLTQTVEDPEPRPAVG